MKIFKPYIVFSIILFLSSCSSIKEGFSGQKKANSDEFLVEKKSPLVMPPDYNELPLPKEKNVEKDNSKNQIKSLITETNNKEVDESFDEENSSFENSILKKIKKN